MKYLQIFFQAFARWFLPLPAHDDTFDDGAEELSALPTETPAIPVADTPEPDETPVNAAPVADVDGVIDPDDPSVTRPDNIEATKNPDAASVPSDPSLDYADDRDNPAHSPAPAEIEPADAPQPEPDVQNPTPVEFEQYVKPPEAAEERASRSPFRSTNDAE